MICPKHSLKLAKYPFFFVLSGPKSFYPCPSNIKRQVHEKVVHAILFSKFSPRSNVSTVLGIPTVKRNVQSYLVNILLWKTTKRWNSKLPAFWLCIIQPCIWFSGNYARLFIWQHGGGGEKRLPSDRLSGRDQPPRCGDHQFSCGGEVFRGISEISSLISLLPTISPDN